MKKVVLFTAALCIAPYSFSASIDCNKYSTTFKNIAYQSYALAKSASYKAYSQYSDRIDYGFLFNAQHSGQRYASGKWQDQAEVEELNQTIYQFQRLGTINNFKLQVSADNGGYQSLKDEVCIVHFKSSYTFLDLKINSEYDVFFVRPIKTERWRSFTYLGVESKKDMAEFFPDIPAKIKLSAATYNGKNYAEASDDNVRHYYQYYKLPINAEFEAKLKHSKKEYQEALRKNGF